MARPILDLAALAAAIRDGRVGASWSASSSFGPESPESRRSVSVFVDGELVAEGPALDALRDAIVEALGVPAASGRTRIDGEGWIEWRHDRIELDYVTTEGAPFDRPEATRSGTVVLALGPRARGASGPPTDDP